MKVITVINDTNNFGFNLLRLSCALNGLELIVLISNGDFDSNRIKDEFLESYLEDIDNDEIILFTDGNDVIFMADESEILLKFYAMGKDLVFSAEADCWPDHSLANQYPACLGPYKYLNSGGFIGKTGLIKELLNDNSFDLENFKQSNQYLWAKRYLKNTDRMVLDNNCEIFCAFSPQIRGNTKKDCADYISQWFESNFLIQNHRIFNKITGTWPCQGHFNGLSKWLINDSVVDMLYNKIHGNKNPLFLSAE